MTIVHIACIKDDLYTGVPVAVPQHIKAQQKIENVGFVNILNIPIPGIINQWAYNKSFKIADLPAPYAKPDLVVFHEVYYAAFLKIAADLTHKRIPYIVIPHGALTREAQRKKKFKKLIGNTLLFNVFIKKARAIQYLSEKERAESFFGKTKVIGSNGISVPDEYKKTFSSDGEIRLIYIGNLQLQIKGLDIMLKAFSMTSALLRMHHAKIDLYGPNYKTRHSDVKKLISEYQLEDIVSVHDAISGDEKKNALMASDIFIQTSRSEGMSMGILEAMGYGLPCIVTEGTNLKSFIEDNDAGWGAEISAQSVADAITRAVEERPLWERKSENARRIVKEEFDWDVITRRTLDIYASLVRSE